MANTFFLNGNWDLQTDLAGNIAMVTGPYAIAQNVANAIRLFTRDAYFNQDRGIPHFELELGHTPPPLTALRAKIVKAAKNVDGVRDAAVTFEQAKNRVLTGEVQIVTDEGATIDVGI